MQFFPFERFSCDWAYTIDGGAVGELEYENFNAASAKITFYGCNIHPGYAKHKMINALALACEFQNAFPATEVPEQTDAREGFFHLNHFDGTIEKVELQYLIRDFDSAHFEKRKQFIRDLVEKFNRQKRLLKPVELVLTENYKNMYEVIKQVPQAIEIADLAMKQCNITPNHKLIRGGTDGAWLAEKGLACPNIFTGGYNFHSKHELITLEGMKDAVNVIVKLLELATQK